MNQYLQIWDWLLRGVEQLEVFGPKFVREEGDGWKWNKRGWGGVLWSGQDWGGIEFVNVYEERGMWNVKSQQQREREYQESTIGNRKSVIGTDEMGSALIYEIFSSASLITLGLYHLVCAIKTHLHHPARDYSAKLYHPFSSSPSSSHRLRHLQLYVIILFLLIAFVHQTLVSSDADPLLKGRTPVHRFSTLQSAAVLFLFLILALAILLSETTSLLPLPSDLFFALASALFYLQFTVSSSAASVQTSDLQAKCDSVSARVSALSSLLCIILACLPRLFVADLALGASVILQGLWTLQTGLALYVEAFIPEGCHKLLDVVSGVEGSTKCDLEESRLRAVAILDLVFVVYVMFVVFILMATYAVLAKTVGIRRTGSYEALPTLSSADSNHIQMKTLAGTQAWFFLCFFFPYIESAECVALPFHLKQCNPKKLKTFSVYKVSFFVSTPHYILSSPSSLLYNSLFYTCYAG